MLRDEELTELQSPDVEVGLLGAEGELRPEQEVPSEAEEEDKRNGGEDWLEYGSSLELRAAARRRDDDDDDLDDDEDDRDDEDDFCDDEFEEEEEEEEDDDESDDFVNGDDE